MKIYNFIFFFIIGLLSTLVFISCKSDEPNETDDADNAVLTFDGERLTSVNNFTIEYDSKGRVSEIVGDNEYMKIYYNNGEIELNGLKGTLSFNKSGYISEFSLSWDETYPESGSSFNYKGSGRARISYDYNGYLTNVTTTSKEIRTDIMNNESYEFESYYNDTFNWSNGNLTSATETAWETQNGDQKNYSGSLSISYTSEINKFNQFPLSISNFAIGQEPMNILASAGLFGKGTSNLPFELEEIDTEGNSSSFNIWFDLNTNGSFRVESNDFETFNYFYSVAGTKSANLLNHKALSIRNFFVKERMPK